jgi:hypothetical protein
MTGRMIEAGDDQRSRLTLNSILKRLPTSFGWLICTGEAIALDWLW